MMAEFDKMTQRRGTSSVKWDFVPEGFSAAEMEDVIPLWVADMDFEVPHCVLATLQEKLKQGIFGYTQIPDAFYQAIVEWFGRRHHWHFTIQDILPIDGLVPAASIALKSITEPGDEVIVQTPAYNCFFSSVRNIGCRMSENRLRYEQGRYTIDYEDLEKRCRTAKAMLFCNPHNPSGRLWSREELLRVTELCEKYGVVVVSDEIHCDIVPPGSEYIPMASLSQEVAQHCISLISPTKCFNLAGLMVAGIVTINPLYREKMDRVINIWEHCDLGQMGVAALSAAFSKEGEAWLNDLNAYIHENYLYLKKKITEQLPSVSVCPLEATYLVWLDCSSLPVDTAELKRYLIRSHRVWVNEGAMYGDARFLRVNVACPRRRLEEGLERLVSGIKEFIKR